MIVLASVTGKGGAETQALMEQLRSVQPEHALLADVEEKSSAFDTAAAKYSAKVAS